MKWKLLLSIFLAIKAISIAGNAYSQEVVMGSDCQNATTTNADGDVFWNAAGDYADLVSEALKTGLAPSDFASQCLESKKTSNEQEASEQTADTEKVPEETEANTSETADSGSSSSTSTAAKAAASGFNPAYLSLGLAGAGGGGGGGGGSSTFLDENTTFTYDASLDATWVARQEYKNARYGSGAGTLHPYTTVGVNNAYARGLSGSGKVVAVHDSAYHAGNHKEFAVKKAAGNVSGYGTLTTTGSWNWHGQHVAGTIGGEYNNNNSNHLGGAFGDSRDYGMMGVAYNAKLRLSDVNAAGVTFALALADAESSGAIAINNSWGVGVCQTGSGCTTIDQLVTHQNNNSTTDAQTLAAIHGSTASYWANQISAADSFQGTGVVVFANGNDFNSANASSIPGLPVIATELADAWLTVGNLNVTGASISSGTVTRIGNACGAAAEFCIFADGTHIWSSIGHNTTSNNAEFSTKTGSSMAAPIVSGSIALLSEAFPNQTPAQLQDRILASANNDFYTTTGTTSFINGITHGYNSEFGHGLLDLAKALGPISTSSMIPPSGSGGSYGNITSARRFPMEQTKLQLGFAFGDAMHSALSGRKAYFYDGLNGGFAFDMGTLSSRSVTSSKPRYSFDNFHGGNSIRHQKTSNGLSFMSHISKRSSIEDSMMLFTPTSKTTSAFIGKNINVQNALSFTQRGNNNTFGVDRNSAFNVPFISASQKGTSLGNTMEIGEGMLSFGVFEGKSSDFNLKTSGFIAEFGREKGSTHTSFFTGITNEDNGFLETSVEGAFAEQSKAKTAYAGVSSYGWLNDTWSYNALGSFGSTDFAVNGVGLLRDIDSISSSSFAVEVARPVGLAEKDSVHIGVSQPIRVESGDATLLIPELYERGGELTFSEVNDELSPSGRQIDAGVTYQARYFNAIDVGVQLAVTKDPGHVKTNEMATGAFGFVRIQF